MKKDYFNVSSVRLMRFLYALGFDKESIYDENGVESWNFKYSQLLQQALNFYFDMRNQNKK